MKKILLPTDCSELGDHAYGFAHKIAAKTGADIEVLSIVPAPPNSFYDTEGNLKNDEGKDYSEFYEKKSALEKQVQKWIADKPDINKFKVKIGRVEEDILHYINAHDIDLIVMGTAGAYGVDAFLKGSHTNHIVRISSVPVLCLKCDRSDMEIKDILLLNDFEKIEKLDLNIVKDIQGAFGARLNLLRVNTPKHLLPTRKVKEKMKHFVHLNQLENTHFHVYCDTTVEEGISNFSADTGIDFLALGTHQRKGLSRMFKHSISEDVVNHLWQPVLTFPV